MPSVVRADHRRHKWFVAGTALTETTAKGSETISNPVAPTGKGATHSGTTQSQVPASMAERVDCTGMTTFACTATENHFLIFGSFSWNAGTAYNSVSALHPPPPIFVVAVFLFGQSTVLPSPPWGHVMHGIDG